jgi:Icc-related predicted phosphoesterase
MKILHLSDTHGQHHDLKALPEADVIVHSGDFTFGGSEAEAADFINWFCGLKYQHKVFIAGNHDMCMYGVENIEGLPSNVHYLCNSEVVLEGIRFYGVPMFMEDYFAGKLDDLYRCVPDDTEVLITHQPPYGFCDAADYGKGVLHQGNPRLAEQIQRLQSLKCHLYGHEHDAYGLEKRGKIIFSNAALLTPDYRLVHGPTLIDL